MINVVKTAVSELELVHSTQQRVLHLCETELLKELEEEVFQRGKCFIPTCLYKFHVCFSLFYILTGVAPALGESVLH